MLAHHVNVQDAHVSSRTACRVNDGFCDCPDGTDEPGSNACGHLLGTSIPEAALFHCADGKHALHTSMVDDGVCDCEDASDEQQACTRVAHNGALGFSSALSVQPPPITQRLQGLQHS